MDCKIMDLSYNSPLVKKFEELIAKHTGSKYVVATNSGTSALFLALKCLGVKMGDRVITQAYSFVATTNAIAYTGAIPMFTDVFLNGCMNYNNIKELKNKFTPKAIVCAHLYGSSCDMDEILKYNIPVVEDAAQGFNCFRNMKHLGTIGKAGALSFNGGKLLFTGGGGAMITNDKDMYDYAQYLSTTAKNYDKAIYYHEEIGYNLKMCGVVAKFAIKQYKTLKANNFVKDKIDKSPYQNIANFPPYQKCIRTELSMTDYLAEHGKAWAYVQ